MKGRSDVTTDELIKALTRMKSKTGSLADSLCCFGCGREHNCGVHGCAIIREAIKTAKLYQAAYKVLERQRDCDTCLYIKPCGMDDLRCTVCTRAKMEMGQRRRRIVTKIILVVLVISATLTECIVMRKSREYDAADNIAGLERCVKAMVVFGLVDIAAAVAFVAM